MKDLKHTTTDFKKKSISDAVHSFNIISFKLLMVNT